MARVPSFCHGDPATTSRTRSSSSRWPTFTAVTRCPTWGGSKVPPKTPILRGRALFTSGTATTLSVEPPCRPTREAHAARLDGAADTSGSKQTQRLRQVLLFRSCEMLYSQSPPKKLPLSNPSSRRATFRTPDQPGATSQTKPPQLPSGQSRVEPPRSAALRVTAAVQPCVESPDPTIRRLNVWRTPRTGPECPRRRTG